MNRGEIQTADWLPDGSRVLYLDSPPKTVRLASLSTGETTDLTANENANLRYTSPLFSPDGRRVYQWRRARLVARGGGPCTYTVYAVSEGRSQSLAAWRVVEIEPPEPGCEPLDDSDRSPV